MLFAGKYERRLRECEDKLDAQSRQVRSLEMEWESTYNKLRALVARLNKRDERADALTTAAVNQNPDYANAGSAVPRQWELAQLAARNGGKP